MSNVNYLSYVTREYVNHLTDTLEYPYYKYFYNIFQEIKNKTSRQRLSKFQKVLVKMSKWDQELIDTEMKNLMDINEIEYLNDLLTAIFVSMTKMMSSNSRNDHVTINLMVPKDTKFLYMCLKEISRELYVFPYLYQDYDLPHFEIQRNLQETNRIIKVCIERVIRRLLPMKTILDAYLGKLLNTKPDKKNKKRKKNEPEPDYVEQDDNMTINSYVDNSEIPEKPDIEELVKQEMEEIKNTEEIKENPEEEEPVEEQEESTEEPTEEPTEEVIEESTEEVIEESTEEVVEEPVEEPSEEVVEDVKEQATEEVIEEILEEPEEKIVKVDSHPDLIDDNEKTEEIVIESDDESKEESQDDDVFFDDANKE